MLVLPRVLLTIIFTLCAAQAWAQVDLCDRYASDWRDPQAVGVPVVQLDLELPLKACITAVENDAPGSDNPRTWSLVARLYYEASLAVEQDSAEAAEYLSIAELILENTAKVYPYAAFLMGDLKEMIRSDYPAAAEYYDLAGSLGYPQASRLAERARLKSSGAPFDTTGYVAPGTLSGLFEGNYEDLGGSALLSYLHGFSEVLANRHDCRDFLNAKTVAHLDTHAVIDFLDKFVPKSDPYARQPSNLDDVFMNALRKGASAATEVASVGLAAKIDAELFNLRHGCDSPTSRVLFLGIDSYVARIDAATRAAAAADNYEYRSATDLPLHKSQTLPFGWWVTRGQCSTETFPSSRPLCNRLYDLMQDGNVQILQCIYGPLDGVGRGWDTYNFWLGKGVPDVINLTEPGSAIEFRELGTSAASECPPYSGEAKEIRQAGRLPN